MMQLIRKNLKIVGGVIVTVVVAFIGTIFLVWGRGGGPSETAPDAVAWIGETPVTKRQVDEVYDNLVRFYSNLYQNVPFSELDKRLNLGKAALDTLVNREVVIQEAARRGVTVSDDEVRQKILANVAFQANGRFDQARYLEVVRSINQTPGQFEEGQRQDLLVKKMEAIVKEGVKVTDEQALEEFRRGKEKISLDYVLVPFEPFKEGVNVGDADVTAFFEKDKQAWFQPDRIMVEYVRLEPSKYLSTAPIPEADIAAWYDEHKGEFLEPRTIRARHILFKLDAAASADEDKKIKARAESILEKAKKGTDFTALAKEFSQDSSGPRGGDLGWFSEEQMVPEFSAAAFALNKGEVGGPVKTQFGYHLIKVEDVRDARTRPLEEAREAVAARLRNEEGTKKVQEVAQKFSEAVLDRPLDAVAAEYGLTVKKTGFLAADEQGPDLPLPKEVKESLFRLNRDEVSDEIRWGGASWFFRLVEKKDAHVPELAEVRDKVRADLTLRKAKELASAAAASLKGQMESGAEAAKVAGTRYKSGKTAPFARSGFAAELSSPGTAFAAVFPLQVGGATGPIETPAGYAVVRVASKETVSTADFEKEKDQVKTRLWDQESDRYLQAWVEELKKRAGVKYPGGDTATL
jgi:peptidyl-prolyl cis-trans isomerase D